MHSILRTASLLLPCAATLHAQMGPTVSLSTFTDYGVLASDGHNPVSRGVPAHTAVGSGLDLAATLRGASAHVSVTPAARGAGVTIHEEGSLNSTSMMSMLMAGTTGDTAHMPFSPHTILMEVGGVREMDGVVTVHWAGRADGAVAACAIDLDGDHVPEFSAHATGTPVTVDLPIHRNRERFALWITTAATAHLQGSGTAGYGAQLDVEFRPGGGGGGCTLTPYGDECAGRLAGRVSSMMDVELVLTGSFANAFGLTLVGPNATRASLGPCLLLVEPAVAELFSTDARGGATHRLHVPGGRPIDAYIQDLVLDLTPPRVNIGTSNGLHLDCR